MYYSASWRAAIAHFVGSRRWLAIFAAMVIACAVAGTVNRVIKIAAGRSRPAVQVDAGWNGPRFSSKYHAFPSGHTAASTCVFPRRCLSHAAASGGSSCQSRSSLASRASISAPITYRM
jgi:membrane-associated phospholipid phosphatase